MRRKVDQSQNLLMLMTLVLVIIGALLAVSVPFIAKKTPQGTTSYASDPKISDEKNLCAILTHSYVGEEIGSSQSYSYCHYRCTQGGEIVRKSDTGYDRVTCHLEAKNYCCGE